MRQSRISELEGMDYSSWSVSTLRRLARALGVRFMFGFESWGDLLPEMAGGLSRAALYVPSFENDPALRAEPTRAEAARADELDPQLFHVNVRRYLAQIAQMETGMRRSFPSRGAERTTDRAVEALLGLRPRAAAEPAESAQNPLALAAAGGSRR
jgi:hypothetical protein